MQHFMLLIGFIIMLPVTVQAQSSKAEEFAYRNTQKLLNQKEVKEAIVTVDKTIDNIEDKAEKQWDITVGKLIKDYKESDIPRKLKEGDYNLTEEAKKLLQNEPEAIDTNQ